MANANPSGPSATASTANVAPAKPVVRRVVKEPKATDFKQGKMGEDKMHEVVEDNDYHIKTQLRSGTIKISRK